MVDFQSTGGFLKFPVLISINDIIAKYSDLILAAVVMSVLSMIIIPLPTPLLDILLTIDLTIAIIILLVSLYISDALKIASFPTILLITTLFRLALNVASTRLILSTGHAGEVIAAFGKFVVSGNYVVGAVLFSIITLINFIVIAKGAERVYVSVHGARAIEFDDARRNDIAEREGVSDRVARDARRESVSHQNLAPAGVIRHGARVTEFTGTVS